MSAPSHFVSSVGVSVPPESVAGNPQRAAREPRQGIQWLAIGFVAFFLISSWGPLLLRIQGMYVPELVIGFILIHLRICYRRIFHDILACIASPVGVIAAIWLCSITFFGAMQTGAVVGPYSELRSSLILVYASLYFFQFAGRRAGAPVLLHRLAMVALCLEFALELFRVLGTTMGWISPAEDQAVYGVGRSSVPAITIAAAGYLSAQRLNIVALVLVVVIGGVASLGGHRLVLLVTALMALLVPVVGIRILLEAKLARVGALVAVALVLAVLVMVTAQKGWVTEYLENASGIRYRLFEKTQNTLTGLQGGGTLTTMDAGEESIRVAYLYFVLTHGHRLLLPHGLGSREVYGQIGGGFEEVAAEFGLDPANANTHDTSILYYSYHHGLIAAGLVVIAGLFLVCRRLVRVAGVADFLMTGICLTAILAVDLFYPPVPGISLCFMYGGLLGIALNPKAFKARSPAGAAMPAASMRAGGPA